MRIRKIEDCLASTKTIDTLPIGTILPFASDTIPTGWLLCDGTAISRTTYKPLFDIIGTSFGRGDGSTTFNLPNMKGKTIVGMDSSQTEFDTLGETGGEKTHKLTVNEMPSHAHGVYSQGGDTQTGQGWVARAINGRDAQQIMPDTILNTGGDQPHNNLQPYIVTNYIIKAEQTVGLTGQVTSIPSESKTDTYSCEYINNKINGTVLWTNNSLGSSFNAQTISLDLTPYDYIEIVHYRYPSTTTPMFRVFLKVGDISQLNYSDWDSGSPRGWNRELEIKSTGIVFKQCTIDGTTNNYGLVPGKIIGH